MTTTIITKKAHVTDAFRERADRKMAKLEKFFNEDAKATIVVSTFRNLETVEVTVTSGGLLFRSEKMAPKMIDALEAATDMVYKQIVRNRGKLKDRMKTGAFLSEPVDEEVPEEEPHVVKTKTFPVRFMSVDEAILQMELLGHNFFMFRNEVTNEINVLYKRNDGQYGVLEPEK